MRDKRPVIEFITANKHVAEMYPPTPAYRSAPDWWRNTPGFAPENQRRFPHLRLRQDATVKTCPGIGDFLNMGWVLPLWGDFIIEAHEKGFNWQASCKDDEAGSFIPRELGAGFPRRTGDHTHVLKIMTPWQVRAAKGWSLLVLPPIYHTEIRFSVMPGVIESDRLPVLNAIAEWHVPIGHAELLKAGLPLLHLIPFRRCDAPALELTTVTNEEWLASFGPGLGAVEGARLAAGAYREDARNPRP